MLPVRDRMIMQSLEALRLHGYNALGVQEIADAAHMPKGSFYNHFASKEEFAVVSLKTYAKQGIISTERILSDERITPYARLIKLYNERVGFEKKRLATAPGCLINMLAQEMSSASPAIREAAASAMQQLIDCVAAAISKAEASAEIDPPMPARELAAYCEAAWRGALILARAENRIAPLQTFIRMLPITLGRITK